MSKIPQTLSCFLICILLAACENKSTEALFSGIGAVAGGFVGGQFGEGAGRQLAGLAGGVLGGLAGGGLYATLSPTDKDRHKSALHEVLGKENGEKTAWSNPDTGNSGFISAAPSRQENGQTCRLFHEQFQTKGKVQSRVGKACRSNSASGWDISDFEAEKA